MQSRRPSNANWLRGTRFVGDFSEPFVQGQISDPGPVSYRGPGQRNFLYGAPNVNAENRAFKNNRAYKEATTFIKVYPICGTQGYFSLQSYNNKRAYLIAVFTGSEIVARVVEIANLVNVMDRACWRELNGCADPNNKMLENKLYPGLVLTINERNIKIASPDSVSEERHKCWGVTLPPTIDMLAPPEPLGRIRSDYDVRDGENIYDNNQSLGPTSMQSYELDPIWTHNWEECLDHSMKQPLANSFVFIKPGHSHGNCRTKVGGYWKENRNSDEVAADKGLVSGMLN